MDPERLAVYDNAFRALDESIKAQEAGNVAEAKRLRNIAAVLSASVPPDPSAIDDLVDDGW